MQVEQLTSFLTTTGVSRELHVCIRTLQRRIESGEVIPDGVLVECAKRPGSLIFRAENLPKISAALAEKPK